MKKIFFSSLFILLTQQAFSQKVFSVNYANQADVKVKEVRKVLDRMGSFLDGEKKSKKKSKKSLVVQK